MTQPKAADRLTALARSLQQAMDRMETGKLGLAELEQCTEEARALYERLVVLRHKAREATVLPEREAPAPAATEAPAAPKEPPPEPAQPSIRLDTRPQDAAPLQTSLIDAIAESEGTAEPPAEPPAEPAKATAPKPPKPKLVAPARQQEPSVSLGGKIEHAPVADLRKAIALSQKFWFIAELFGGDRDRYEKAIDALNAMKDRGEAEAYMRTEITGKLAKPPGEEVGATFMELIQRRYS